MVWVLTRTMEKIIKIVGAIGAKLRDGSRSEHQVPAARDRPDRAHQSAINQDKLKRRYRSLLNTTSRVVGQAKRFSTEITEGGSVADQSSRRRPYRP
jgi:transposase, IS5 family